MAGVGTIQTEILAAALGSLEDGIAVLDADSRVLLWNAAAAALAGYASADLLSRTLPGGLFQSNWLGHMHLDAAGVSEAGLHSHAEARPVLVHLRHKQGHTLPVMLRRTVLRDALGKRFGTLLRFHPVEDVDTLPHGLNEEEAAGNRVEPNQAGMEDRLDEACQEWRANAVPFGLLWINVDQGAGLRKTHGRDAMEAMLEIVERTLLHALRPAEVMGRWGSHEFLVLCHERSTEMLAAHAERVAGLAGTAHFQWWGDRVSLTVSIGAAQAEEDEKLSSLLLRAQEGMQRSRLDGGNRVMISRAISVTGGQECSQL